MKQEEKTELTREKIYTAVINEIFAVIIAKKGFSMAGEISR